MLKGSLRALQEAAVNGDDGVEPLQLAADRRAYISCFK
jgi:hypothetical protein